MDTIEYLVCPVAYYESTIYTILVPSYLYQMVTKNMLRACEGNQVRIIFLKTVLEVNKCLKQIR